SRTPQNIFIDPGMHIPAAKSTEVAIKANLNSGLNIGNAARPLYALDSIHGFNKKTGETKNENDTGITQFYTTSKNGIEVTEKGVDAGALFNGKGQGLNLREGQGIWVSYANSTFSTDKGNSNVFDPNNKTAQNNVIFWGDQNKPVIMDITLNGVQIRNDNIKSLDEAIAYINTFTNPADGRDGTGVIATKKEDGSGITFTNQNSNGTTDNMKNIDLQINTGNQAGELQNVPVANGNFNWNAMNLNSLPAQGDSKWIAGNFQNNGNRVQVVTAHKYVYSSNPVQIAPMYNPDGGKTWN
ncbi:flagellar hook protein FlgE, partial [Campylobacter jejuni]|nr:flagellar hook protein FlgE [Campylobacter jejuni]